jgi:two-component system, OmpR family, response regulator
VFVGRLRKKLGVDVIQTLRGLGYLIGVDGEPGPAAPSGAKSTTR